MPVALCMADFDLATRSASGFLLRYIAPRVEPVQLYSFLDRRITFRMFAPQADLIVMSGHGSVDTVTGQNEEVIMQVGKYSPSEVKGKVAKLLSCQTGVQLGPDMVRNGCLAFMGYVDDYVWVMDADLVSTPWMDKMAASSLMPVVDGLNSLLDGSTSRESLDVELNGYSRNAELEGDELVKSCLLFNKENAVLLGDGTSKVRSRPALAAPFKTISPPPLPLVISGLFGIAGKQRNKS